jgi:anti-sigma factor RsiW
MSHLGRWLSALVDDELDGDERDRVLNHLARCTPCRQEANALRALKRRMTALAEDGADSAIAGRLMDLARTDAATAGPSAAARWPASWPAGRAPGSSWVWQQVRSGWMLAASSAGLALAAIGAVAFVLGGTPSAPVPQITPAVETYWLQHGYDTGQAPAGGAGSPSAAASGAAGGQTEPPVSASSRAAAGQAGAGSHRTAAPALPGSQAGAHGTSSPLLPPANMRHSP